MTYALSAPVFSEIGAQPSGRVTRVPEALMRAISSGVNIEKNVSAMVEPFASSARAPCRADSPTPTLVLGHACDG